MPAQPPPCANPLFLQWLEELRDAAREKGLRTADVYAKGCRSLAACPIAYARPRELVQLQGIGPKTVAILETRLKAHCEANGTALPPSPPRGGKKRRDQRSPTSPTPGGSDTDADPDADPPAKRRRARAPKAYIPQRGSGAYGILLGLLLAITDPERTIQVFLTKGELVRAAQPYCASSYDHAERGGFATAWNGIKTLVNKGYVFVQGSPHRYCLTEDGYDVAATLRNMHPDFDGLPRIPPLGRNDRAEGPGESSREAAAHVQPAPVKFGFWYIDDFGKRVSDREDAKLMLDPDEFVALRRIQFREAQRSHPIVTRLRRLEDTKQGDDGEMVVAAYIVEESAPPMCSGFGEGAGGNTSSGRTVTASITASSVSRTSTTAGSSTCVSMATASISASLSATVTSTSRTSLTTTSASRTLTTTTSTTAGTRRAPRLSSQLPLLSETGTSRAPAFDASQALVFPPGSYEVVLILDTREVESKSNRDKIADSLAAKGIKVETRALRMGDMCWIARRRDSAGGEEDECVLDYVIERKRLDDLCSSIRDGRYHEQSFRLTQSGIGNIFYVVEDWQLAERMEFHGKAIMTAKSQIQVVSGFFLKETHKLADTIDFLATMTRVIAAAHSTLYVIPSRFLSRTSYVALQRALRDRYTDRAFLTTFESYQALNDKGAARTVYEGLARMLLCVKGMSPERVAAILDKWDTPRALYEAMCARHARGTLGEGRKARGPEMMFADNVPGEGRRKVGDAQSRDLWRALWGVDGV